MRQIRFLISSWMFVKAQLFCPNPFRLYTLPPISNKRSLSRQCRLKDSTIGGREVPQAVPDRQQQAYRNIGQAMAFVDAWHGCIPQ